MDGKRGLVHISEAIAEVMQELQPQPKGFPMLYIGIDPGVSGGIAIIDQDSHPVSVLSMPDTEHDTWLAIKAIDENGEAIIEQLGGMPRGEDGKAKQSPTTMLTMGRNYGGLRMALVARGIRFDEVLPVRWQKLFGLIKHPGETKTAKKNRHKAKAQQLFPAVKVTHAIADALLLAEYLRRTRYGQASSILDAARPTSNAMGETR